MHGNVSEWCNDSYAVYETFETVENPYGPSMDADRVNRGGSWNGFAANCMSGLRNRLVPWFTFGFVGFRVAAFPSSTSYDVQAARVAARRTQAANNLRMLGLALHNFHDTNRALPAAYSATKDGKPLLSWRVHILPYVEAQALYEAFHLDEPWDSEHNKRLLARMPAVYRSTGSNAGASKTNYLGVRGSNALFIPPPKEMLGQLLPVGISFAEVTDGTSNTLMVIEVPDAKAVEWTKPDDWEPNFALPLEGVTGSRPDGIQVLFADGSVRFLSTTLGPKAIEFLITRNGGE
jgi:prepilin-type processing-associated H-X9-DG protein